MATILYQTRSICLRLVHNDVAYLPRRVGPVLEPLSEPERQPPLTQASVLTEILADANYITCSRLGGGSGVNFPTYKLEC
jgi:hypothetical protein